MTQEENDEMEYLHWQLETEWIEKQEKGEESKEVRHSSWQSFIFEDL